MQTITLPDHNITIDAIANMLTQQHTIRLSEESLEKIGTCRKFLEGELDGDNKLIYGINTGFGALCNVKIAHHELSSLQHNLVRSHACGTGELVPKEIIKLMLLLKIRSLAYGHSGIKIETINRLLDFYNQSILPVVYNQGSLGASGDLAPLAHLSLPLFGEGEVMLNEERCAASLLASKLGLSPLSLSEKEGLALLNGTQFMSAYAVHCLIRLERLFEWSIMISALSCDAFDCRTEPFHPALHQIRAHTGQIMVAEKINHLLQKSDLAKSHKIHVQDPYSFRCIPQVLGASYDALYYAKKVFEIEINSVTDNPNIFPDEGLILSGGNFHGQPLALAMDFLAMAVHEAGNISDRRVYQLVSGKRDLPMFLSPNPGLQSGMMIPQYTAASLVNQNKHLANPCSTDSIESSAGQEDHVSMGANSATKLLRITDNLEKILGIELLVASQAIAFRRPTRTSASLERMLQAYRIKVPFVNQDRVLHYDIEASASFLRNNNAEDFIDI
jgi:histidine ammonia-lyase